MEQLNVLGESLQLCCTGTGFQRNGFCEVPLETMVIIQYAPL